MKELSKEEMLKEIAEYGVTEEGIRKEYEYEKNESDNAKEYENISFEEYLKAYYMSDKYIIKKELTERF